MNIGEFLNYRKACPICDSGLTISFLPSRKNAARYENGRLLITSAMSGLKKGQGDYKVGYSFGLNDDSFAIEFFDNIETDTVGSYYGITPIHLIEKFKKLDTNLGGAYRFCMRCTNCKRYQVDSSYFALDFKTATIEDIEIDLETIGLTIPIEDKFKIIIMANFIGVMANYEPQTILTYWRSNNEKEAQIDFMISKISQPNEITLPLIPFVSREETAHRLDKLITFS